MRHRVVLLSGVLALVAVVGCTGSKPAPDRCADYRDHVIDLRLRNTPTPSMADEQRRAELDKHREVLTRVAGPHLVQQCKQANRARINCALEAEDTATARKCMGQVAPNRTASMRRGGAR